MIIKIREPAYKSDIIPGLGSTNGSCISELSVPYADSGVYAFGNGVGITTSPSLRIVGDGSGRHVDKNPRSYNYYIHYGPGSFIISESEPAFLALPFVPIELQIESAHD